MYNLHFILTICVEKKFESANYF